VGARVERRRRVHVVHRLRPDHSRASSDGVERPGGTRRNHPGCPVAPTIQAAAQGELRGTHPWTTLAFPLCSTPSVTCAAARPAGWSPCPYTRRTTGRRSGTARSPRAELGQQYAGAHAGAGVGPHAGVENNRGGLARIGHRATVLERLKAKPPAGAGGASPCGLAALIRSARGGVGAGPRALGAGRRRFRCSRFTMSCSRHSK
jgi:hypothetical protein